MFSHSNFNLNFKNHFVFIQQKLKVCCCFFVYENWHVFDFEMEIIVT